MFILIIVGILVLWFILLYNGFIRLKHRAKEAWSGIDVQLKRRYDLIPNIVETVKGYVKHEKETLEKIVKARNRAIDADNMKDQADAENMITGALKSIFALAESYPDLKANQNFLNLQGQLAEVEDQIQMSRRYYNGVVRDFNIKCEAFPSVIVASMFQFEKKEFFEIEEAEKEIVKVKL